MLWVNLQNVLPINASQLEKRWAADSFEKEKEFRNTLLLSKLALRRSPYSIHRTYYIPACIVYSVLYSVKTQFEACVICSQRI